MNYLSVSLYKWKIIFVEINQSPVKLLIEEKSAVLRLSQDEENIKNRVRLLRMGNVKMQK